MENRVKFYRNDQYSHEQIESKMSELDFNNLPTPQNINDALEYYEIVRFMNYKNENGESDEISKKIKILKGKASSFLGKIPEANLIEEYQKVDCDYRETFWSLLEAVKCWKSISGKMFLDLLNLNFVSLEDILKLHSLSEHYRKEIREYIFENKNMIRIIDMIRIILDWYYSTHGEQKNENKRKKKQDILYRPKEFTGQDIVRFIEKYVALPKVNLNYLRYICFIQSSNDFPIEDSSKVKVQHRIKEEEDYVFKNFTGVELEIILKTDRDQKEPILFISNNNSYTVSYSEKYMERTLNFNGIFLNLKDYMLIVDKQQMRSVLVNNELYDSLFEQIEDKNSKDIFYYNNAFKSYNFVSSLCTRAYYLFLKNKKIRLEEILEYFYTRCLMKVFGCPKMRIKFLLNMA